jgi:hypothetical protein
VRALSLFVGGKDIPALETILAAHHYDVAAAWQYLKEQIPSAGPPSPSSGKMGRPAQFAMFSIDSNYKPLAKR